MPDLGNLSLSAALKLSHCSSDDALDAPVKTLTNGFGSKPAFEPRVLKRTRGSLDRVKKPPTVDKAFQDRLKDPFLVGAPKMGECCFCCHFIYPGDDELLCSVRGCDARYHSECAKEEAVGPSTLKKFKCQQHVDLERVCVGSVWLSKYRANFVGWNGCAKHWEMIRQDGSWMRQCSLSWSG
ncbi:Histone-lysine N-methyltransferase ASHR3 [Glycine soja]|nr:Histone-lysine N-methyltransferase ASHR3 [Glycine soja]